MSDFWHGMVQVARNEMLQQLRTRRLLIIGGLLIVSLVLMTIVLPITLFELDQADVDDDFTEVSIQNFAFFLFLNFPLVGGYLFMQLLSIILTADAVSSEWQRKTLFLLLSKPVPRSAFVLGKFIGAVVPLVVIFLVMFVLDYLVLIAVYPGSPSGDQVGRFFGCVAFLLLGAVTFAAMGLFFSSVTRTSVGSLIWALAAGLLLFPIVGAIGDFALAGADGPVDEESFVYDWSHYVTPNHVMTKAGDVLLGEDVQVQFSLIPTNPPQITWLAALSGVALTVLFVVGSLVAVTTRNFE